MMKKKFKRFFTTGDIARYCEIDVNTVKRWIRAGRIRAFRTPTGHHRIERNDFISFINDHGYPYNPALFGDDETIADILIVEDELSQIKLLTYLIQSVYYTLQIESATNGFEGYRRIDKKKPKLAIIDLNIPDMSGLELIQMIRKREDLDNIRIAVVSAFLDNDNRRILKELKVSDVISKPVKVEELETLFNKVFGEA